MIRCHAYDRIFKFLLVISIVVVGRPQSQHLAAAGEGILPPQLQHLVVADGGKMPDTDGVLAVVGGQWRAAMRAPSATTSS